METTQTSLTLHETKRQAENPLQTQDRFPGSFPLVRLRRTRQSQQLRNMVRETHVVREQLIYPIFLIEGLNEASEVSSMPGIMRWSLNDICDEVERVASLGISAIMLLGASQEKDDLGSQAYAPQGIVQQAVRRIKAKIPNMVVIANICPCTFTNHGYCGVVRNSIVQNDETLELIARTALSLAVAGADMVAPSSIMDGRIGAIRRVFDKNGFSHIPVMSYSAKYASCFYDPYFEAMGAERTPGENKSVAHQLDPANAREALREVQQDILEGADIVMVKPALGYLDVVRQVRDRYDLPIAAYNVGGEYSMVKAAAMQGWINERETVMEMLVCIARAGADLIITYWAPQAAQWLTEG